MQSVSEAFIQSTIPATANPPPPSTIQAHPHPPSQKRRPAQRVFLKDRPEAICQLQINEIQKLNQQLTNYKNQYRMATGSTLEQDVNHRQKGQSFISKPQNQNETLKQILSTGQEYRNEILAAQEKRMQVSRQNAAIRKQLEAFSREKEGLIVELSNERSKNSILEQELFMVKDTMQKYKNKTESDRHELFHQIKTARTNMSHLETLVKELTPKANLLPFYQQKLAECEFRMGVINQQMMQVRNDLRYYQEKSNYFQANYTVLNENFNNLYTANINLNNQLKQNKNNNNKLQANLKNIQEECRKLNSKCLELAEEKNKMIIQLNSDIVVLAERIKGEHKTVDYTEKVNQKLNYSLDQIKKVARELQTKNQHLEKEIQSKESIIFSQKILNEQLQSSLKQLQANYNKKEQFWKNSLANQLVKLSNESNSKALSISSQLIKSEQNTKTLSVNLARSEQQLQSFKEKADKLQKLLDSAYFRLEQQQKAKAKLKQDYDKANIDIVSYTNGINQYQKKLTTALAVQQQISTNSKATLDQKTAKIKQLQAKIQHLSAQNHQLQLQRESLHNQIAKLVQVSNMIKCQLQQAKIQQARIQEKLKGQEKKSEWLKQQNNIKEQIIARYNSVTEEMREKISNYYNDIVDLSDRNHLLEEEISQSKKLIQTKQAQLTLKAKIMHEQSQRLLSFQRQALHLKAIVSYQSKMNAELHQKHELISQNVILLSEKLTQSETLTSTLEIALKETVENLTTKRENEVNQLDENYKSKLEELENNSQKVKQQNRQAIDSLKKEIKNLKSEIQMLQDAYRQSQTRIQELTLSQSTLQQANNKLNSQNQSKSQQIVILTQQRQQMARLILAKAQNIQQLKVSLIELDQTYRNSIEQTAKMHQQKKNQIITQWNQEKQTLQQKVSQGNLHLSQKVQLQQQLKSLSTINHNIKVHLESEQIRIQSLTHENEMLRRSLKQMHENFILRLQGEVKAKFKYEQDEFDRLHRQIQKITTEKSAIRDQHQRLARVLTQRVNQLNNLSRQNQKLQQIVKRNIEIGRAQSQFLKRTNIQLQIQLQNLINSTQSDNRIKTELSHSVSSLQLRNSYLQEYMNRSKNEVAAIQAIFQELKQQRDLLIKKYIVLTNEIYKINSLDANLNRELDSFAQYFSKVSTLHTEINKHLYNITHFSQLQTVKTISQPRQPSKMEESIVQKVNN